MSTPVPTPRAAFHPDAAPKNASTKRCCLVREEARGCLLGLLGCLWGAWQGQAGLSPRVPVLGGGVVRNSDPRDRREDAGNSLLQPVAMAAYFREASKGGKKKEEEENQNILLGGKKNSGVKKCRRVMRRPSEAKKCMRSSLETGV